MANYRERVLGPNGFESFPERLKQKAIEQGNVAPEPDKGVEEPLIENGKKGKAEVAKSNMEAHKEQLKVNAQQVAKKASK